MGQQQLKLDTTDSTGPVRTFLDVVLVLLVVAVVITVAATGPSTTYAYAQLQQIGAVVGSIESGNWLLPRDQLGGLAIKPQLYAWLDGPVLMITGIYNDFTFRLPTVFASLITGVLVYFLGRRWYGRRVGLLAACLWATAQHMGKMSYVAITDMLLSLWILLAIMCADRLLFHRAPRGQRWKWAIGLWAAMILGAVTKGWGIANLILIGGALALATAAGPGFKALRLAGDSGTELVLLLRIVGRRWRRAMKATYFAWGILAMVVVLTPIWVGMFIQGGDEFAKIFNRDVFQRITGSGENPPHSRSTGPALNLLYYALPMSVFAV
ncbi:MAG: glycosyltransferase family 39 protein, partial [Phycisphaerae bacterium]|nr:glycosyltransferase family 39 protein [Phycisphaerae bacterium]